MRRIWRFHADRGGEFCKHADHWLNETSIWHSMTAGYDPQANGMAEAYVDVMARGCRSLSHKALWAEAITFISEERNRTK